MTKLLVTIFLFASACGSTPPEAKPDPQPVAIEKSGYDQTLAKKLNADPYGMAKYVFATLERGEVPPQDTEEAKAETMRIQKGHMENIQRLADQGLLVLAGPFLDDGAVRGIFIFDVETVAEAEALVATDPAIQSGRLKWVLRPWYGSAAVRQINETHNKIQRAQP